MVTPVGSPTGRIPSADDFAVVGKPVLECVTKLAQELGPARAKWAIGGDAGEVMSGVNIEPDRVIIVTTAEGCDEICGKLVSYQIKAPEPREVTLGKQADIDGKLYPVRIRSRFGELVMERIKVEVYGDIQIKVGEWDWGDPIDYEPAYIYTARHKVPVIPLNLSSELYLGLGWMDRIELITASLTRAHRS